MLHSLQTTEAVDHPALGEAIDGDSSGAISVYEINSFFDKKPMWMKTIVWLA
jgi:hypothetical protein